MSRRKDGYIEKTVTIDGKRVHVYGRTEREIRDKIEQLYDDKFRGITDDVLFKEYSAHWMEVHGKTLGAGTRYNYERLVLSLNKDLGHMYLVDIRRSVLERVLNNYIDMPGALRQRLKVLKLIFAMAVDDGLCWNNPTASLKYNTTTKSRDRLTAKETEAVKNADLPTDLRLMLDILYYTGIRRGELLGLTRKSIGDGVLHITQQLQFHQKYRGHLEPPKTEHSIRDIPITKHLEGQIRNFMKGRDTILIFDDYSTDKTVQKAWKRIEVELVQVHDPEYNPDLRHLKFADIPCRITPHYLRHNYASLLHDNGVDLLVAQKLLGHASPEITLKIYTHLDKEKQPDKYNEVRNIFAAM